MLLTARIEIERPAEEVFAYLSNFENNPVWQGGMESARFTSEGPIAVGSTYEQLAHFLGREVRSTFEIVALEPGRLVRIHSIESTFPIRVTRTVETMGEGRSRVCAQIEGDAVGFFMRLMSPLMERMAQRSVTADYANLKRILEQGDISD